MRKILIYLLSTMHKSLHTHKHRVFLSAVIHFTLVDPYGNIVVWQDILLRTLCVNTGVCIPMGPYMNDTSLSTIYIIATGWKAIPNRTILTSTRT